MTVNSTPIQPPPNDSRPGARSTAGFPSPADDYVERPLDLNRLLIKRPAATFFMRASGNHLRDTGIANHDLLIIDRAREVTSSSIVIALVNGELQLRRFSTLKPETQSPGDSHEIWGVVTCVIHEFND